MKTIYRVLTALFTISLAAGCAKESFSSFEADRGELTKIDFRAGFSLPTRTGIEIDESAKKGKVIWKKDDIIRYYSSDGTKPREFTVPEDGSTFTLTADVHENDKYLVACYGGGVISESDCSASGFVLSDAIKGEQDGSFAGAHISVAKTTDFSAPDLIFRNVSGVLTFEVKSADIEYVIFVSNDNTPLHANGKLKITFDGNGNPKASAAENSGSSIRVNIGGKAGTYYVATLPAKLAKGFTCYMYDKDSNLMSVASSQNTLTLEAGTILRLGELGDHTKPVTDLCTEGRANCYLISQTGLYRFNASTKGNGFSPVGNAASARVLWETTNTEYAPEVGTVVRDVRYIDGQIAFSAMEDGNALIAVVDADDNILWSWHIWVCKGYDAKASAHKYYGTDLKVMDRNLGALSTEKLQLPTAGLLYQWGRKDPFTTHTTKCNPALFSTVSASAETGTVEYASANPATFVCGVAGTGYDWMYSHDATLWGTAKSVYDPCPPGWKVPENNLWSNALGEKVVPIGIEKGVDFGGSLGNDSPIWYPISGYRAEANGAALNYGVYGYYWSSTVTGGSSSSFEMNWMQKSITISKPLKRAVGASVRCIAEAVEPEPEPVNVKSVSIQNVGPEGLTLNKFDTFQVLYQIDPTNADVESVKWTTDNGAVATVNDGLVTAVGIGEGCRITLKITDKKGNQVSADFVCNVNPNVVRDLSEQGTANCYIVSSPGDFKFRADVRGSTTKPVGAPAGARTVWESYGTSATPYPGALVSNVNYENGYVTFTVYANSVDGNAIIAVEDNSGNILWSWHIWLCRGYDPDAAKQTYINGAVMMDRNLGATSVAAADARTIGLLYQWGRKDPFPAGGTPGGNIPAGTTAPILISSEYGTVEESVKHPDTFITNSFGDWQKSDLKDDLWGSVKTEYDPCPAGWQVPDGGESGVFGSLANSKILLKLPWNENLYGLDLSGKFGEAGRIWFPATALRLYSNGTLDGYGQYSMVWTAKAANKALAYQLYTAYGNIGVTNTYSRAAGAAIRCVKEGSFTAVPVTGIEIGCRECQLKVGESVQLQANVLPSNATNKYLIWYSDSDFVTVDSDGVVTAGAMVSDPVTVCVESVDGQKVDYCIVTVTEQPQQSSL